MRILHIIIGLNVGGAELMLRRLIESHHDNPGYRHAVISLTDISKVGLQLKAQGIEVRALGMRSSLNIPLILWRLMRLIRDANPDIVQTWMYHADLLGGLAARLVGNQHVIWGIRTTDVRAGGSRVTAVVRWVCAWLSYWVPHTIVCAAEASRQVHVAIGYDVARMKVVHNGFDILQLVATKQQRECLREQFSIQEEDLVIGSVGRFNPVKDQENFVKAAGILVKLYSNVRFMMVGRDLDTNNTELNRWISETGHADRFVLLGERSDVPACLSAMDIFCLHSRTEGFPNGLGEAMAMGLPSVVTDVGDATLLLGKCGIVVSKEDPTALAQGLKELMSLSPADRTLLGHKARQRIHDEFTLVRARERFEAIYDEVLTRDVS